MRTITSPRLLLLKFALFVTLGTLAAGLILVRMPSVTIALLLIACVWAFARAYYFCFYVIERFVDPRFRFSGVLAALRFAWSTARKDSASRVRPLLMALLAISAGCFLHQYPREHEQKPTARDGFVFRKASADLGRTLRESLADARLPAAPP